MHPGPGDDAADERDEEQQVDRREPDRGVDLEEAEPVEPRSGGGVARDEVGDLGRHRSSAAGRSTPAPRRSTAAAAGTARCACCQLAARPSAAQPTGPEAGLGDGGARRRLGGHHSTVVKPPTRWVWTHATQSVQTPVTIRTPTARSSTPPNTWIPRRWRRSQRAGATGPRVPRGDEDERDAEAERVGHRQDHTPPDGPAVGAERRGQREDRGERRAGARRPAEREDRAEQGRAGEPGGRLPARDRGALQPDPGTHAEEDQRQDDHDGAADPGEQVEVLAQRERHGRRHRHQHDEHDGEAEDEEQGAEDEVRAARRCSRATSERPVT